MKNILDIIMNDEGELDIDIKKIPTRFINYAMSGPEFFTPYKGTSDVATTLATPITYPIIFGVSSCILLGISCTAACVAVASLVLAGMFSHPWYHTQLSSDLLYLTGVSALTSIITAGLTAVSSLAILLSVPYALLKITTRSVASMVESSQASDSPESKSIGLGN